MTWLDAPFAKDPAPAARRQQLASTSGATALVSAGTFVGRNYRGNPYPFRASSHFLYLLGEAGAHLPGAHLLLRDGAWTLFTTPPDADDALWHGPTPTLADLQNTLQLDVQPLDTLAAVLRDVDAAALPAVDGTTRQAQHQLLQRTPALDDTRDAHLAQAMIDLRLVHDAAAIDGLRQAARGTVKAHAAGMAATAVGEGEWHVHAAMEHALMQEGMTTAYGAIVSVHGEVLHNHGHSNVMQDGDLLLVDVGAETPAGYAGDVTRTWPVNGRFSSTQRDIYDVVLAAERAAIDCAGPGVRYRDVHLTAARVLTQGLKDLGIFTGDVDGLVEDGVHALFFPHGVGHLLGLDVHDMEDLGDLAGYAAGRARSEQFGLCYLRLDRDLQPGMAVTIEPGFYQVPAILDDDERCSIAKGRLDRERLADFADVRGIRLEDDVLITEDGREVLTRDIPIAADDVEAAVGQNT